MQRGVLRSSFFDREKKQFQFCDTCWVSDKDAVVAEAKAYRGSDAAGELAEGLSVLADFNSLNCACTRAQSFALRFIA